MVMFAKCYHIFSGSGFYRFALGQCFFVYTWIAYIQESLAFMFEMSNLHEDSLREYDELELCYSESGIFNFIWE